MIPVQGCPQSKGNELVSGTGMQSIKIPDVKCVFTEELWDAVSETFFSLFPFHNFSFKYLCLLNMNLGGFNMFYL